VIPRAALAAHLRLARTENVGPRTYRRLMAECRTPEAALEAVPDKARKAGLGRALMVPDPRAIEDEIAGVEALGGRMLVLGMAGYPPLLARLPDAPPVLSVLGDPDLLSRRHVGVVGARNASAAGMRIAEALATELAAAGVGVVSGLARGIDAAAHKGALAVGVTVAAVAGGLDRVYPPEHAGLQAEIAARGVVVTEAPLGTVPQSRHFPGRNRIIAGLSLGCVVVEAALRSGTLITARLALAYDRALFAVPGSPLDPRCRGSNDLLRGRATLTEGAADIVPVLPEYDDAVALFGGFAEQAEGWSVGTQEALRQREALYALLSFTPTPVDELAQRCQFSVSHVLSRLSELELAGRCVFIPGGQVVRTAHGDGVDATG